MSVLGRSSVSTTFLWVLAACWISTPLWAQEPLAWGEELVFHTFSIAGVDPETGESGVAVTTRNACVGNGVPWVRVGVGAVATQASTRTAYGQELLDMLEQGMSPQDALDAATAADDGRDNRQIGVVSVDGRAAQFTGEGPGDWAGHRSGRGGRFPSTRDVAGNACASFEHEARHEEWRAVFPSPRPLRRRAAQELAF